MVLEKYFKMDKDKIIEIANDVKNKSNKDLVVARDTLNEEHENTKQLVINLTKHMDVVKEYYDAINDEIGKRMNP